MTKTQTAPIFTATCRRGHVTHGTADQVGQQGGHLRCACGALTPARVLSVTIKPDHKCGAKCTSALGATCDCSCGGEHHGSDHRHAA
jgi:hypothetical protein